MPFKSILVGCQLKNTLTGHSRWATPLNYEDFLLQIWLLVGQAAPLGKKKTWQSFQESWSISIWFRGHNWYFFSGWGETELCRWGCWPCYSGTTATALVKLNASLASLSFPSIIYLLSVSLKIVWHFQGEQIDSPWWSWPWCTRCPDTTKSWSPRKR